MRRRALLGFGMLTLAYFSYYFFLLYFLLTTFGDIYPYPEVFHDLSLSRIASAGTILILCMLSLMRLDPNAPEASIIHMFMVLAIVPALALFASAGVALWSCLTYLYFTHAVAWFANLPRRYFWNSPDSPEVFKKNFLVFISLASFAYFFSQHGIKLDFNVFSLKAEDIYETRLAANEERGQFARYLYSWSTKIFLPLCVVYGIITRQRLLVLIGALCMTYLFLTSAHKSVLLSLFLLLAFSGPQSFNKKNILLLLGLLSLLIISYSLYLLLGNDIAQSLFIRRMLILPSILNQYYYNIYSEQLAYYSHSFLSWAVRNPYSDTPPYVVGLNYTGSADISFNNGFISDGFANIGYVGAIFHSTLLAYLLALLCKYGISVRYYGFLFIFVYQFSTSATFTTLLSHGFLLLLLMSKFGFLNVRTLNPKKTT